MTPLKLSPVHLVRVGAGPEPIRVEARGLGVVLGSCGVRVVAGALDAVLLAQPRRRRVWALFVGFPFLLRFASATLPPAGRAVAPTLDRALPPAPPRVAVVQTFAPQLTIEPPQVP